MNLQQGKQEFLTLWGYFFIFFFSFLLFLSFQTAGQTLLCPDSFYHAKMASFLAEGKLIKNFPWLPYTILAKNYSDHHFLYHLILIPFVLFLNPLWGIKIATLFFATLTMIIFYWFLKKFKVRGAFVWTMLLLTSSVFLTRLNLAKLPAAALPVLFFGLYALFKKKYLLLTIISFIYVWLYNTWPILLVAVITYCLASALKKVIDNWPKICLNLKHPAPSFGQHRISNNPETEVPAKVKTAKRFEFRIRNLFRNWKLGFEILKLFFTKENIWLILTCLLGVIAGLVINPYFPQNLYFDWVHIVKIGLRNYQNLLPVGIEWYPYNPIHLILNNPFILIPWLISLGWFLVSFKKRNDSLIFGQKTENICLFVLSFLFFIYTIKSRRNVDYFIPLAVLFTAFSFNNLFSNFPWKDYFSELKKINIFPYNLMNAFLVFSLLIIFLFSGFSIFKIVWQAKKQEFAGGANFNHFQGAANFLKKTAESGEIIFHSSWDEFPMLFYHNDKNYYIAGLDPTFFYEENKSLYWLWFNIVIGKQKKHLAEAIKNNFKASYVFIQENHKAMKNNFAEDKNFEMVYEDKEGSIYKIKNEK